MIRYIKGEYLFYDKGALVVDNGSGIGFRIYVSDTSPLLASREGDIVIAYTHLHVKEDEMSLYGFESEEGLRLFEQLITVSGVGPKAGLAIMSLGTVSQIKAAIVSKDAKEIAKAPGVGKKTAERVIIDLSDKISSDPFGVTAEGGLGSNLPSTSQTGERAEAVIALTTLGYTKKEAETAVRSVGKEYLSTEDYIKKALKYLM